jgi:hypothetical protein
MAKNSFIVDYIKILKEKNETMKDGISLLYNIFIFKKTES